MSQTRYNLKIPTETYKKLKSIARQEETTIADLLRRATKLLLFVRPIKHDPGVRLLNWLVRRNLKGGDSVGREMFVKEVSDGIE